MKDANSTPLYIGKAVNLRARVKSYFTDPHADRPQIPLMLRRIHDLEWIVTTSETEALILEANLIRKHQPRFNIELKDDKHYPYLKVTVNEPFPRLLVVRRVEKDGARYFGPYTDSTTMRMVARFAQRLFRIRDCSKKLPLPRPERPCINFSMHRCPGVCAGKMAEEEYRRNVSMLIKFLQGNRRDLLAMLEKNMQEASAHLDFETAALCRDQIRLINDASRLQRVDLRLPEIDCDVFGLHEGDRHLCLAVLAFREGLLIGSRHFLFSRESWDFEAGGRDHLVLQYYMTSPQEPPQEIVVPEGKGFSAEALGSWFAAEQGREVRVSAGPKGTRQQLLDIAEKNARLYILHKTTHDPLADLQELQKALRLPVFPRSIEAFDISNLGPAFAVAGMVHFEDGVPKKSEYRRYKIKTVAGQNDFAMMMEVVTRRLRRLTDESKPFPDVLLIDGGKGQLHAAMDALRSFENAPFVISLAKQEEELFSPALENSVRLPPAHPARKLVERIRDEVHRWAVGYHRAVRGKQFKGSRLETIDGIGPKKAVILLRQFGSIERLREASVEEIAKVKGFSRKAAEDLKAKLAGL